ncbi:hypothetical protein [Paenibacillus sp. CMAA1364]
MNRQSISTWTVVVLAGIGLLTDILFNQFTLLKNLLIPVIVFVVIFLLFRYSQPGRFNKRPKIKPSNKTMNKVTLAKKTVSHSSTRKNKKYPFQVIDGQKDKREDPPKYH